MRHPSEASAARVRVLTPTGRDAEMVSQRLEAAGYACQVCPDVDRLLDGLTESRLAIVAQEALSQASSEALLAALEAQEPWSDVPVLLLTLAHGKKAPPTPAVVALLGGANVLLLQRPLPVALFLSAVQSASRARRRQYQLHDLHRELAGAVQLSDLFISILGHDLSVPLGAISMAADSIVRGSQDARATRAAVRISTSAGRMDRMIAQLLDLARARHGGIPLAREPTDLAEVVRQIVRELEESNPDARFDLVELGDASGLWDPDRLAALVSNLAGNAVRHGTARERITLELDGTERAVVLLRITNAGAIPAEAASTLFEPFKRTAPPKSSGGGLGLGLFIARAVAQAHGGDIVVRSAGDVTVFEVTLPRDEMASVGTSPAFARQLTYPSAPVVDLAPGIQVDEVRLRSQAEHLRLYEAVTENSTLALFVMDAEQRCRFMNPAAERMTGFTLEELQGRPLHDFIHHTRPDGRPYALEECPIDRALPTGNREQGEDVFIHKDGHFYPVGFTASPIVDRGEAVGTVVEVRDTTLEKQVERQLRRAVAMRDDFLSVASHELRTPLTALSLQLERVEKLLQRGAGVGERKALQHVDTAIRQVDRLESVVEGLLDVSRIAAGRVLSQRTPFDLRSVVEDAVERLAAVAERAGCEVRTHCQSDASGTWDRQRLDELLTNLLGNAFRYGSGKPVDVTVVADVVWVTLSVKDQGVGISAEAQARIFERFERAASTNYGGLGLGLYVASRIVEAHGGSIDVQSVLGEGATFTVRLPRAGPSSEAFASSTDGGEA